MIWWYGVAYKSPNHHCGHWWWLLRNLTIMLEKGCFMFYQQWSHYKAKSERRSEVQTKEEAKSVSRTNVEGCGGHDMVSFGRISLHVPPNCPPSGLQGCQFMEIQYEIKVRFAVWCVSVMRVRLYSNNDHSSCQRYSNLKKKNHGSFDCELKQCWIWGFRIFWLSFDIYLSIA